nr:DUF883 C-terminal domain-containing protein [Salinicola sp. S1-1-2]
MFHRDDKTSIDEEMAAAAEVGSRLDDAPAGDERAASEPLEDSIDEPAPYASRYLSVDDTWAARSRRRLDAQIQDTRDSCDAFVQQQPWKSVGIAILGGAFLAMLLSRR